jgi:peptide/nickel transport system permease protein
MDSTGLLQEQVPTENRRFLQGFVSRVRGLPRQTLVGAGIAAGIAIAALLAPVLAPYSPDATNLLASFRAPSFAHPMGTDFVGRDVFSRVLYGARSDLFVVVLVTYAGLIIGVLVGTIAAYFGGWADNFIGRLADTAIAFPFIVIVLAVVAVVGVGLWGVAVGIVAVGWALYARLARTEMLALREHEFMLATRALGYTHKRAILRHAIPNVVHSSLLYSTIDVISNFVVLAAMSYLGLGQQPPGADLGSLISGGQPYLLTAWWISTLPGLVLVVLGVGIGLIGDGLTGGDVEVAAL